MDLSKIGHALEVWNRCSSSEEQRQAKIDVMEEDMILEFRYGVVYASFNPEAAAEGLAYYRQDEEK
jgi:hypothetical protein